MHIRRFLRFHLTSFNCILNSKGATAEWLESLTAGLKVVGSRAAPTIDWKTFPVHPVGSGYSYCPCSCKDMGHFYLYLLTHFKLNRNPNTTCISEGSNFNFRYVRLCDLDMGISKRKMAEIFANSGDPDQILHSATSDLGLHFFANYPFGISRLTCVKHFSLTFLSFFLLFLECYDWEGAEYRIQPNCHTVRLGFSKLLKQTCSKISTE